MPNYSSTDITAVYDDIFGDRTGDQYTGEGIEDIELDEIVDRAVDEAFVNEGIEAGTGATTAATAGVGGAALGTKTTAAVATGVTVGSAIVGGTISALSGGDKEESPKEPIVTLPDHKYLGPGNDANSGHVPLDLDDEFARIHDILYEHAETQEDINAADIHFLQDTVSDIIDNGNYHSLISFLGIGLKYMLESVVGVQYPNGLPTIVTGEA